MQDFSYQCKTKIIFGKGVEKEVGKELKKHTNKILLHFGQSYFKSSGLYDTVTSSLKQHGINFVELGGVVPNPRLDLVYKGIDLCRKEHIEFILAVGGGSVIDSAKAIAAGVKYDGDVWDFFEQGVEVQDAIPIATILTIPAAGSEASPATVISDEHTKRKLAIGSDYLRPVFSLCNPELTISLPAFQTAAGITDMFAHLLERYFTNTQHVDVSDELLEGVMRAIITNAKKILQQPKEYAIRAEIMWASTIAHNGLLGMGREEDWATHRIEHELSAYYDITHGAGLAIMFPAWMQYVYKHDIARFARFARKVWNSDGTDEEVAWKGIVQTKMFFKTIGMPITLAEQKIDNELFDEMAQQCTKKGPVGHFIPLEAEDVKQIYVLAR